MAGVVTTPVAFNIVLFTLFGCSFRFATSLGEVIYAVNCGGESHVDTYGIHYEKDPMKSGIASDFGKQLIIGRVPQNDQILYQTERYHHNTFGYDIPINIKVDGDYVLVLKFCEVYFSAPNMKVFDVVLNGDHTVIADLDIFDQVGRGVAHDEYVAFSISKEKLVYNEEVTDIRGGGLRVEFIKGYRDNPKINALYVMKGTIDDVPKLAAVTAEPEAEELRDDVEEKKAGTGSGSVGGGQGKGGKNRRSTGPKTPDPYQSDDPSIMLPVFVVIGAFIPILFCLCKL